MRGQVIDSPAYPPNPPTHPTHLPNSSHPPGTPSHRTRFNLGMNAGKGGGKGKPVLSRRALLAGAGAGVGATAFGGYWNSDSLHVTRETLRLPRWDADGFRVVQISDIHANTIEQGKRACEAMRLAVAEKPDLIVFTGDYLDYATPEACKHVHEAVSELDDATCPVYGVFGNHDWFCNNTTRLHDAIRHSRIKMLYNRVVDVDGVTLFGIDDALAHRHRPHIIDRDRSARSILALFHEPDYVESVPNFISLQLSGHSHGGEVCLPFGIPLVRRPGARRYTAGFYPEAKVPLYVSKGVATCAAFRFFCPPEINVLTLMGDGTHPRERTISV